MLNSHDIASRLVDGQTLWFPTLEQWKLFQQDPVIDNHEVNPTWLDEVNRVLPYVAKYPELWLAWGQAGIWKYFPYVLVQIEGHLQRVFLERLTCPVCNWRGMTANPTVEDSYIGLPKSVNQYDLMRYANRYPVLPCPVCQAQLPRHPIWLEQ